ncbi:hypothetical protein DAI22_03g077500 [Oryza sativa Japonica Group]|uniref:Expressed protein n=1 Tax=Oryza sativa subsp. japonica TaxID=39947 RepID=Q10QD2_ORYSJ|nr:expressed protein [Oryza sativa Japonica Group]KAF2937826.1 hypothetical protein DAI22_03g077500 [Oryza sativa Japonica Group]
MGGGSIRAAAKAAMIGGYRSASAVRRAVLPASPAPQTAPSAAGEGRKAASTYAAIDDWVIPDREVFGPVPTHEEAMAATLDLKESFQFAKSAQLEPLPSGDLDVPTKGLVHSESSQGLIHSKTSEHEDNHEISLVSSGAPGRVVQAFTMLQDSPEAQEVVASLASDQNVWNAVMRNEKVMKFYKTYATKLNEDEVEGSESDSVQNSSELGSAGEAFMCYVEKMKALVSEMMTNLSSIMQDLVATSDEGQSKGKLKTMILDSKKDFANAPSAFVLLAIASIMVVLLKRA